MRFGIGLPDGEAVLELLDRLARDGHELVEEWDSPNVSVKRRDPDGCSRRHRDTSVLEGIAAGVEEVPQNSAVVARAPR
jgi:hypothetical protein